MMLPKKNGYITLLSVLVVGAVGMAIASSLLLLGLASSRTSFALEQSAQAHALAESCVEEALQQLRDSSLFAGTNTLTIGGRICEYTVTNLGGTGALITASGTVGVVVRKAELNVDALNPNIHVTSWQEVADF